MNKKMAFFSTLLLLTGLHAHAEPTANVQLMPETHRKKHDDIILDSAILRTADGHFITHDDIGIMLQFREYLRTILYGIKNTQGVITGPYLFDNAAHCLRTLTRLEKNLEPAMLNKWLKEVRDTFKERTKNLKRRSEGTKTQQYLYIKESCRLHNRLNSILLIWGQAPEGQEDDAIDRHVASFYDMSKFVLDLMNFLDDMISSCPKAKKLFLNKIPDTQERQKLELLLDHILEQQKAKLQKIRSEL